MRHSLPTVRCAWCGQEFGFERWAALRQHVNSEHQVVWRQLLRAEWEWDEQNDPEVVVRYRDAG